MCTSAPHLDVSLRCSVDAEGEGEFAAIAWKQDDDDDDDDDDDGGSGSWHTEEGDQEESQQSSSDVGSAASVSDQSDEDSISSHLGDDDDGGASQSSHVENIWDSYVDGDDDNGSDCQQYCFHVDRNNVLESSLNSLKEMSKCVRAMEFVKSCE